MKLNEKLKFNFQIKVKLKDPESFATMLPNCASVSRKGSNHRLGSTACLPKRIHSDAQKDRYPNVLVPAIE